MRKTSVRRWIHAILDLLPLFVIPIFAIYTRNENYNSNIEIEVQENKVVDFNQLKVNGNFVDTSWYRGVNGTFSVGNNVGTFNASTNTANWWDVGIFSQIDYFEQNHDYLVKFDILSNKTGMIYIVEGVGSGNTNLNLTFSNITTNFQTYYLRFTNTSTTNTHNTRFVSYNTFNTGDYMSIQNMMLFDLTQMGLEDITNEDFDTYFNLPYYSFTESQEMYIENVNTITYDDTDVGSQFVYTLYNATDKYFNCTNLFNLEQVWNWVQLNLFGGNAPLMVYVVWQVIVYEFFMDLIFLLYSVFMFVIDWSTSMIDKFLYKSRS